MAFRAYILSSKSKWERKKIELKPEIETTKVSFGLPEEAIKEFQNICKHKGLHLSDIEATKEAHNLICLFKVLGERSQTLLI